MKKNIELQIQLIRESLANANRDIYAAYQRLRELEIILENSPDKTE